MNDRRRFNQSERDYLWELWSGRCAECDCRLEVGWHVDHDVPHVAGGPTAELAAPKGGRPKGNHSNGTVSKPGNSETYILRRLKRDRPDLAELVLDGKVTARAAGIAAGFIKPNISVPLDPERLAPILRKKLDPAALDRLRELLG